MELKKAQATDLDELHRMQVEAFMPLYEIYRDEMSPVNESKERILWKINESDFFFIFENGRKVGAVRAVSDRSRDDDKVMWISPLFILPKFQDKGVGGRALKMLFEMYPEAEVWKLSTIKEEKRNIHFYEKLGFKRFGDEEKVNDKLTLVCYELITGAAPGL